MSSIPVKPRRPGSETGSIPRIDVEPESPHEPPEPPPSLPEFDEDGASITGLIRRIATEGEDDAKNADDTSPAQESLNG